MISSYLTYKHIISQIFTVINLPSEFMSGFIQSCIACIIRTGKILLNRSTSYGRNIRHIFFEPKLLCSCQWMSIIQYSMHKQCSDLFTYIMNYLHILCMIFMFLSCVLCMTLMMFIYVYYRLFIYTNLIDIISLFFTVFWFHLLIFNENRPVSAKTRPKIAGKNQLIYRLNQAYFSVSIFHCSS
jgi:hypothetical protein